MTLPEDSEIARLLRLIRDSIDREKATGYTLPWLLWRMVEHRRESQPMVGEKGPETFEPL